MNRNRALPLLLLLAAACGGPSVPGEIVKSSLERDANPQIDGADAKQFAADRAAFALDLYRSNGTDENVVVSPYSVDAVMAMLYAGAEGDTETQIADGMRFTLPEEVVHAGFNRADLELASRGEGAKSSDGGDFTLKSLNQLFSANGFEMRAPFLDTLAANYGAGVSMMDFVGAPEQSRKDINDWINGVTDGLIPELLKSGSIDASIVLVLVNAMYFDGAWEATFSEKTVPFAGGNVAGFGGTTPGRYVKGDGFEAAAIPYDEEQIELVVIEPDDFEAFHAGLDGARLDRILTSLEAHDLDLEMPKFDIRSKHDLKAPLVNLGIEDVFDAADLSGIAGAPGDLYLAWLVQEAVIKVSERGTVAAAATGGGVSVTSLPQTIPVRIDRPFVYALRDVGTGTILFIGHVLKL